MSRKFCIPAVRMHSWGQVDADKGGAPKPAPVRDVSDRQCLSGSVAGCREFGIEQINQPIGFAKKTVDGVRNRLGGSFPETSDIAEI
jgi:hypothetical protein